MTGWLGGSPASMGGKKEGSREGRRERSKDDWTDIQGVKYQPQVMPKNTS